MRRERRLNTSIHTSPLSLVYVNSSCTLHISQVGWPPAPWIATPERLATYDLHGCWLGRPPTGAHALFMLTGEATCPCALLGRPPTLYLARRGEARGEEVEDIVVGRWRPTEMGSER